MSLLQENPLLLLFVIGALGYGLGRLRIQGSRIGLAAVLFVGLAFGAINPNLHLPDTFLNLGLVLFVYTIGLSNGAGFFAKFQREGLTELLFIVVSLLVPAFILVGIHFLVPFTPANTVGIFTGLSNNTPALASVLDYLQSNLDTPQDAINHAVIGFSVVYPLGVLVRMIILSLTQRLWQIDYKAEAYALRKQYPLGQALAYRTILVTQSSETPLRQLQRQHGWDVVFGRIYRGDEIGLISGDTRFKTGDQLVIAGTEEEMDNVQAIIGERASQNLLYDRATYVSRRLFVSNASIAGQTLASLNLKETYGALVSHVRRGDIELLAHSSTVLELGDRIRILAPRDEIPDLTELVGDSYSTLSEVNLLTLGLGITLGLLLGSIPIPIGGGLTFRLGLAGGPLIVALILGAIRRTGPLLWTLPYSANLTLRQFGMICLLATVGIRSGGALLTAFAGSMGWLILGVGTAVIALTTFLSLFIGYKWVGIPYSLLIGMISPQPAVLSYALEQAKNPLPSIGYTLMFPFSIIINVTVAQILLVLLQTIS